MLLAEKNKIKKNLSIISISSQKIFLINHWDYDINIVSKCNKNMLLFYGFFLFSILIREKYDGLGGTERKEIDQKKLLITNQYKQVGGTYGCFKQHCELLA